MSRFLFVAPPLWGHLDRGGYLQTAQAAQTQGHAVLWATGSSMVEELRRQGFDCQPARIDWEAGWMNEQMLTQMTEDLLALAEDFQPDVLVADPMMHAVQLAGEKLQLPWAVCGFPGTSHHLAIYESFPHVQQVYHERFGRLRQRFHLPPLAADTPPAVVLRSPYLYISFFSPDWHAHLPHLPPHAHFVGGRAEPPQTALPTWMNQLPEDRPVAFITLGSRPTAPAQFFRDAANAVTEAGGFAVIATRSPQLDEELADQLPNHTRLERYVSFAHLFTLTRTIIHHGGMGTLHGAIVHGLTQVIVPQGGANVYENADDAVRAGVALQLSAREADVAHLRPLVERAFHDTAMRQRAHALREEFARLGGPAKAAALLHQLAQRRQPLLHPTAPGG